MKKVISTFIVLLMVLPAFTPWLPHNVIHELHDHQAQHHSSQDHNHGHKGHNHQEKQTIHHPIHFDAATYFTDFLHVDLQPPEKIALKSPVFDTQDIDFTFASVADISLQEKLITVQSRAPPDMLRPWPSKTPLYLSTQRIRI